MTYAQAAKKLRMAQQSISLLMPLEWLRLNMKDGSAYMTAVDMAAAAAERFPGSGVWNTEGIVPRCSKCNGESICEQSDDGGEYILTQFCPHCGAHMENAGDGSE